MQENQFWHSTDGQILTVGSKGGDRVAPALAFWPRNPAEMDFLKAHRAEIRFNERSSLARIGIELCNLKLGIRPRVPSVFFNAKFWSALRKQVNAMIRDKRAPAWMSEYILFTDDPDEVVAFYRKPLKVL